MEGIALGYKNKILDGKIKFQNQINHFLAFKVTFFFFFDKIQGYILISLIIPLLKQSDINESKLATEFHIINIMMTTLDHHIWNRFCPLNVLLEIGFLIEL